MRLQCHILYFIRFVYHIIGIVSTVYRLPFLPYLTAGLGSLGVAYIFLNVLDLYTSDQAI